VGAHWNERALEQQLTQSELERQAQREHQAGQHHGGGSPQHGAQKVPPREEHEHEQSTEHDVAQTLDEAETETHRLAKTPDQTSQSYNRDNYHRQQSGESQADAK
jgi:hypothetical protein